jgi:hypothetical protein
MNRYWLLAGALLALVAAALFAPRLPAADEYSRCYVEQTRLSDWAQLRDEDVTSAETATIAGLSTITALSPSRAPYVGCSLRLDAGNSYATITPIFYTAAGVFERAGTATVLSATLAIDGSSQYSSQTVWWESGGAARCKFAITAVGSGTVKEVWGGLR